MARIRISLFFGLLLSFSFQELKAQTLSPEFKSFLMGRYPACYDPYWDTFDLTCADIVNEDTLLIINERIGDLNGLQAFSNVVYLDISQTGDYYGNNLIVPALPPALKVYIARNMGGYTPESLGASIFPSILPSTLERIDASNSRVNSFNSVLPSTLKYLNIASCNRLTSIPDLPAGLDTLICSGIRYQYYNGVNWVYTGLNVLPTLPPSLKFLDCSRGRLTSLPTLPSNLTYLNCSGNSGIAVLPSLPAGLTTLDCNSNIITTLPPLPSSLTYLDISTNNIGHPLTDLPGGLTFLKFQLNQIPSIQSFPVTIKQIFASFNPLQTLPPLPDSLEVLICDNNINLTSLPSLPPKVKTLSCHTTSLTCLPHLPASMGSTSIPGYPNLTIGGTGINCLPNLVAGMQVSPQLFDSDGNPIDWTSCNPVNNSNQCLGYPLVHGRVFYDNNLDGIKNANEYYAKNIKLEANYTYAYSNSDGYYALAGVLGQNTLSVSVPNYTPLPSSPVFNFTSNDTIVVQDIALQASTIIDQLEITLTPGTPARPGFPFSFAVHYQNTGTTNLATAIAIRFDNSLLTYNASSNPAVTSNGNTLLLSEASFVPGQSSSFTAGFTVKTSAQLNDVIFTEATISANTASDTDTSSVVVTGSFDPNDKAATPVLSPQQVNNGDFIEYLIRFQNTGTDTAFNVVVTDTLSGLLNLNSFEMVSTSHPGKTVRDGDKLSFEFINILLPDSNVNEPLSHGYIRFRIKPLNSLTAGNIIPNDASIYFDYNAPVVTNTAETKIQASVVPLRLMAFNVAVNNQNNALLSWRTESEVNTSNFQVEKSNDGFLFMPVGSVDAIGSGNNQYRFTNLMQNAVEYYRLKMIDHDNTYSYSHVVIARKGNDKNLVVINPVKDRVLLDVPGSMQGLEAIFVDISGKRLFSIVLRKGSQEILLPALPNGNYFLKAGSKTHKIVLIN